MIKDWKIDNDTLSFQTDLFPGLVAFDSDGRKIEPNNKESHSQYIILEISDSVMVLEELTAHENYDNTTRLKKSEKFELLNP